MLERLGDHHAPPHVGIFWLAQSSNGKAMLTRRISPGHLEIIFDTDLFDDELKRLGALVFEDFLKMRSSVLIDLSYDVFVSKCVAAHTADTPGQVICGLRINGSIKNDAVA
jgi:hypothetical protein